MANIFELYQLKTKVNDTTAFVVHRRYYINAIKILQTHINTTQERGDQSATMERTQHFCSISAIGSSVPNGELSIQL